MSATPLVLDGLDAVRGAVGRDLGLTRWVEVGATQVADFAEAVGGPVEPDEVPPYLLLSLTNLLLPELLEVRGVSAGVNYGTGEVRFPAPVAVGARVRAGARVAGAEEVRGGVQTSIRITLHTEGVEEPALVVDSLSRWLA